MPKVFGYVELNSAGMEKSRITSPGPFPIIDYDPAFGVEILDNKITSHWIMNGHYTELDKGTVITSGQNGHVHDVQAYIDQATEMKDIQGQDGNWNYDDYMCGMFNGMELILATIENRDPAFRTLEKSKKVEQLLAQADKEESFASALFEDGDKANSHYRDGYANGIRKAVKTIQEK